MEIKNGLKHRSSIISILSGAQLPCTDLPDTLENFIVALNGEQVIGTIGLEIYGNYGLLRSLTVSPAFRNKSIAGKLIEHIEKLAISKGIKEMFLLTESAQDYFARKDYQMISRSLVPGQMQQSSQLSHVCPQSATIMKKKLGTLQ